VAIAGDYMLGAAVDTKIKNRFGLLSRRPNGAFDRR